MSPASSGRRYWSDRWIPVFGPDSRNEEIVNSITHAAGALLFFVLGAVLVAHAVHNGNPRYVIGITAFAVTAVNLYTVSTVYHLLRPGRSKAVFRLLDHVSIYLLIAGTYTVVTLTVLPGRWRWIVFGLIWGMAILGTLYKIFLLGRLRFLSVVFYVAMGWLVVIAWGPLVRSAPPGLVFWILLGGAFYTPGTIFLALKKVPFNHAVWHFATIGGTLCHAIGMLRFLVPG